MIRLRGAVGATLFAIAASPLGAQARQTESDEYTRYELLEPGSAKFRIVYEVTATTPGATYFFNPSARGASRATRA
jgi:hypothetical protein